MLVLLSSCVLTDNTRDSTFRLLALQLQGGRSIVLMMSVLDEGHDTFGGAAIAGTITNAKRALPHAFRKKCKHCLANPW